MLCMMDAAWLQQLHRAACLCLQEAVEYKRGRDLNILQPPLSSLLVAEAATPVGLVGPLSPCTKSQTRGASSQQQLQGTHCILAHREAAPPAILELPLVLPTSSGPHRPVTSKPIPRIVEQQAGSRYGPNSHKIPVHQAQASQPAATAQLDPQPEANPQTMLPSASHAAYHDEEFVQHQQHQQSLHHQAQQQEVQPFEPPSEQPDPQSTDSTAPTKARALLQAGCHLIQGCLPSSSSSPQASGTESSMKAAQVWHLQHGIDISPSDSCTHMTARWMPCGLPGDTVVDQEGSRPVKVARLGVGGGAQDQEPCCTAESHTAWGQPPPPRHQQQPQHITIQQHNRSDSPVALVPWQGSSALQQKDHADPVDQCVIDHGSVTPGRLLQQMCSSPTGRQPLELHHGWDDDHGMCSPNTPGMFTDLATMSSGFPVSTDMASVLRTDAAAGAGPLCSPSFGNWVSLPGSLHGPGTMYLQHYNGLRASLGPDLSNSCSQTVFTTGSCTRASIDSTHPTFITPHAVFLSPVGPSSGPTGAAATPLHGVLKELPWADNVFSSMVPAVPSPIIKS
eukprot:jgi/Chrzof1/7261/Cz02g16260.t1